MLKTISVRSNVLLDPLEGKALILDAIVAAEGFRAEEAERTKAVVGRDNDHVVVGDDVGAIIGTDLIAIAKDEGAAVEPNENRERASKTVKARGVDVELEKCKEISTIE